MATYKHLRSSTANKRPTPSIADGQLAINNNSTSAGLFFKDSTGATIIKIGPVHVGTTAPNATPGAGGSSGNSTGEVWLDTSLTPVGVKIWNGSAWVNGTPTGSTTVQGLLELATDVETQAGSDAARAVTPAGLQSKVSDSTSTTSSTTIASSTAVKSAYDLANAALPKSGGTVTGNLEIGTTGSLTFEGSTADGFETTLAVVDPTGDRTITLPNISGTVVTTGDTGTVTSTMLLDGTIVNADINASAAIAGTKISPDFGSQTVQTTGVVSHALGTALAPTVTFTGDTNTGLFSPGSDQLALATGGTGRLLIDADGNAGLGTASPTALGGHNNMLNIYGSNATGIIFGNTTDSTTYITKTGANLNLRTGSNGNIVFSTTDTERMRLDSSGRLGLGTSSPGYKLDVNGEVAFSPNTAGKNTFYFTTNASNDASLFLKSNTTDKVNIQANGSSYFNGGNVGIGTASPGAKLSVSDTNALIAAFGRTGATGAQIALSDSASSAGIGCSSGALTFGANGYDTERARIDSSGRLLVGTSSARSNFNEGSNAAATQIEGIFNDSSAISITQNYNANTIGPTLILAKNNSQTPGTNVLVANGDQLGGVSFQGNDGSKFVRAASVRAEIDGTPGTNDMPGRLVFSTTADGASSPTERARITSGGYFKASDTGSYNSASATYHELRNSINNYSIYTSNTNASFTSSLILATTSKASANDYHFFIGNSGGSDDEFRLRGDGEAFADGAWTGGGADYAEYFEWSDGNPDEEDRRGIAVVLDGDKIRSAEAGEDPIGVISGNPSVVGDAAWNKWSGKYLRDEFGTYIQEDYEVEDEDGNTVIQQHRKLNPVYDPDVEYISREERPEWDCVGLMGKLRIRKGQPTGSRWIKMRDISNSVEEWLVR